MIKKITLLLLLLTVSLGYSQTVIEDFEGAAPTIVGTNGSLVSISSTQAIDANSLEIISTSTGDPWQQGELTFQGDWLDLTTTKSVDVEVYSLTAFNVFAKVVGGANSGPDSATSTPHGGMGWQTITLTFNQGLDGTGTANDAYERIFFFYNWVGNGAGTQGGNLNWQDSADGTFYVDNITGMSVPAPPTCSDGIQNQGETEIDCGGPNCDACIPDAPNPSTPPGEVLALLSNINDTGGFTNFWNPSYFFGVNQGEPDLDQTAGLDKAVKMDFSVAGWGGGINSGGDVITDVSAYGFLHFDYYIPTLAAGVNGHQIKMILIGFGPAAGAGEYAYILQESGGDGTLVFDSWQSVDVPLSLFVGKGWNTANFAQFKIGTDSDLNSKLAYFDNIYFTVNEGTLGIEDVAKTAFSVYPNPSQSSWTVRTENINMSSINVFDVLGKNVMSLKPNKTETVIDASSLKSGLYFAQIKTATGISSIKLIKN